MFNSAVRTLKAHRVRPDAGQRCVVNVKLKIKRLPGLRAPASEITHRVARDSQEKEDPFLAAFSLFHGLHRPS